MTLRGFGARRRMARGRHGEFSLRARSALHLVRAAHVPARRAGSARTPPGWSL